MSTSTGYVAPLGVDRHLSLKNGVNVFTLTDNLTLTLAYGNSLVIDPGGSSRNVVLPAEATSNGAWFEIKNSADAAENLVVKDDAGNTIRTINRYECAVVRCDGTSWYDTSPFGFSTVANLDDNGYFYGGDDSDWNIHHDNDKGLAINVADNDETAFVVQQGTNAFFQVDTRNDAEVITIGDTAQDPTIVLNAGALNMVMAGKACSWALTADGAADDLTIAVLGAVDSSLVLSSAGTGADALQVVATAGGIDITSALALDLSDGTATITLGGTGATSLSGATTVDLDCTGALQINSSAGAISIGNDANAFALNLGTGAAARVITIGNAASASLTMEAGVGGWSLTGDTTGALVSGTTMDLQAGTALTIDSSGGAIKVGGDDVAQNIEIGNCAAARSIIIGNAASASIAMDAGVGGFSLLADTTIDFQAAGAVTIDSSAAAIKIGGDAVAQNIEVGNCAAARALIIGNAASASLTMEAGVGAWSLTGDTTGALVTGGVMDLDAAGALSLNSSAAAINVGNDAVAAAINVGTAGSRTITLGNQSANTQVDIDSYGTLSLNSAHDAINIGNDNIPGSLNLGTAGARTISIGSAAAASLALEGGVGAVTIDADTTVELNSSAGAILIGNDPVAQAIQIGNCAAARAITIGNAASASISMDAGVGAFALLADTTIDLDAGGAVALNSTAGALSIGNDAVAQPVNIATGAAARVITVGNAASASLALEGGVGAVTIDADSVVELNSSAGAISIGNDAVAQPVNIATGGAARVITIGNAASASIAMDAGVGGFTLQADTTIATTSTGNTTFTGAQVQLADGTSTVTLTGGALAVTGEVNIGTVALVAAGDVLDVAGTISHATGAGVGIHVTMAQITNVRTAGVVSAVAASVESLAGDTAGVAYNAFEARCVVGEANADHSVIYSADAFDYFLKADTSGDGGATVGAMTAKSPESDAEAGYLRIEVNNTVYEIPFYAIA